MQTKRGYLFAPQGNMHLTNGISILSLALLAAPLMAQQAEKLPPATSSTPSTAMPADAPPIYKVGGDVTAPKLISSVKPQFTELARKKKVSGNCLINLTVDTEGRPQDVHVAR